MTSTSLLPSYQRFVNGVPVPLFSRRAFRPREKYLILLVFLTFGVVCFGAFFFLPDFRGGTGGAAVNSVYKVYQRIQKAGPELLIPAPPHAILGPMDPHGPGAAAHPNGLPPGLGHHEDNQAQDIHLIADKQKLQAKINEEYQQQKTLEKPEVADGDSRVRTSSASSLNAGSRRGHEELLETVPPAPADALPRTVGGEDKDPVARERRDKVKEIEGILKGLPPGKSTSGSYKNQKEIRNENVTLGSESEKRWWVFIRQTLAATYYKHSYLGRNVRSSTA